MHESDLHLEANEASDLCRVFAPNVHARHGWDRALLTVLDEAHADDALAVLVHAEGRPLDEGWEALRVHADPQRGSRPSLGGGDPASDDVRHRQRTRRVRL